MTKVFQYCVHHNYLHKESGLQYDKDGNEFDVLKFMILDECHCHDKYIPTKRLFVITHDIYFPTLTHDNLHVINLSNKIVDVIIGGLEQASNIRVDTTDKISLYDTMLKSLELPTKNLIQLLHLKDDVSYLMKTLDVVMPDIRVQGNSYPMMCHTH